MTVAVYKEIGVLIRKKRIAKGLSQAQVALRLGHATPQFVSFFERGISKVPLDTLGELIVYLELPEKKVVKLLLDALKAETLNSIKVGRAKQLNLKK